MAVQGFNKSACPKLSGNSLFFTELNADNGIEDQAVQLRKVTTDISLTFNICVITRAEGAES